MYFGLVHNVFFSYCFLQDPQDSSSDESVLRSSLLSLKKFYKKLKPSTVRYIYISSVISSGLRGKPEVEAGDPKRKESSKPDGGHQQLQDNERPARLNRKLAKILEDSYFLALKGIVPPVWFRC